MRKTKGALGGLIGGSIVGVVGILLLRQGLYIINSIYQLARGLRTPNYDPFYTAGPAGLYILVLGLVLCAIIIVLWVIMGTVYGMLSIKRQWNKNKMVNEHT